MKRMNKIVAIALVTLALLLSAFFIVIGFLLALFGSRADTSLREQAFCLWVGIVLLLSGLAAFPFAGPRFRKTVLPCILVLQITLYLVIHFWGY
jgi:hypothetical protein